MRNISIQFDSVRLFKIRFIHQYLNILLFLSFLNGPLNVLGSALAFREITTYFVLYFGLGIDLLLVLINLKNFRLKPIEQFILSLLIFSFFYGLFNNPDGGRRYITDSLIPMMLVLKVAVFRSYILNEAIQEEIINFLKKYATFLFFSSFITVVFFYLLLPYYPMYVGLTPIIYPFLCSNIVFFNGIKVLFALLVILLSGKRALIVGTLVILFFYKVVFQKKLFKTTVLAVLAFFIFGWVIQNNMDYLTQQDAFSKYKWTYDMLMSEKLEVKNSDVFDIITGGRIAEIEGSFKNIKWYEYIIGRGSGFTYDLKSVSYGYVKNHSNAHFTPVALISKYGVVFYITFMTYIILTIVRARKGWKKHNKYYLIVILMTIGTIVDSCFAYVFFVDNFLPIGLGFLQANIQFSDQDKSIYT